ncbi:tetratricopeptide repeat-containing diguanylate cyclase [Desulfohalovibrio reitneri]|uniref:tetratricopeptide repeat-containing diguanylate cyclase n=1 Tax=Desulfohalovibrio reitneri TaxID=1307759 RepID=UPI0004A78559|nr:tetratricopeptide repeat protein [Desulfohalovibrio reitneri]
MNEADSPARLTPRDCILLEAEIAEQLSRFLRFGGHSLYFPDTRQPGGFDPESGEPLHLPDEKRLLLPLIHHGRCLAVFVAKDVRLQAPRTQTEALPQAASLILDNLALAKAARRDPATGLLAGHTLEADLTREIEQAQSCLLPSSQACLDPGLSSVSGRLAVLSFRLEGLDAAEERHGADAAEALLREAADTLRRACPEQVACAQVGDNRLAALWPGGSRKEGLKLARYCRRALVKAQVQPKGAAPTDPPLTLTASGGVAVFPADLSGPQITLSPRDMARTLLSKAALAADAAAEDAATAGEADPDGVTAFDGVLSEGGRVLECLPLSRFSCSLGRRVDAQEGMRFAVSPAKALAEADYRPATGQGRYQGRYPAMPKGEAVLVEVQEEIAIAEVLHLADPAWTIEPGDRLVLLDEAETPMDHEEKAAPRRDMVTGLYSYRDFLSRFARERGGLDRFGLVLARLLNGSRRADAGARKLAELARETLGRDITGGRYSLGSLCLLVPDADPGDLRQGCLELAERARDALGASVAIGAAAYPFLDASRADLLENCRKALDHAQLLDEPKVALFDSVSLNISADRLFTHGDHYGAMEEYKRALLADENNNLARNSLAVCLARLGRLDQARALFHQVCELDPDDLSARYNLGCACLRLGEHREAAEAFADCLRIDPGHVYSLIRLGQLAEQAGEPEQAEDLYQKAAARPGGLPTAHRFLARAALARDGREEARHHLHQAVTHNPHDAGAIAMLARLYLDEGEDPAIATTLARQAAEIKPKARYLSLWAEALERQGKSAEAQSVRARAESARA